MYVHDTDYATNDCDPNRDPGSCTSPNGSGGFDCISPPEEAVCYWNQLVTFDVLCRWPHTTSGQTCRRRSRRYMTDVGVWLQMTCSGNYVSVPTGAEGNAYGMFLKQYACCKPGTVSGSAAHSSTLMLSVAMPLFVGLAAMLM